MEIVFAANPVMLCIMLFLCLPVRPELVEGTERILRLLAMPSYYTLLERLHGHRVLIIDQELFLIDRPIAR